ncbi:MAG: tetratricopeptide repeat protein [Candidatus Omnitrophota bacterium]
MSKVDLERERKILDREITLFHFKKAKKRINRCLGFANQQHDRFFFFYFLSQHFILREDSRMALRYLNSCLKLKPYDGCSYNDKALCFAQLGKHKEAMCCFDEGIRAERDCVSLYHNKGWLLHLLGRYREAILYFRKALELEENRAESLYSLADAYEKLNQLKEAKRYFQKALGQLKGKSSILYKEATQRLRALAKNQ